MVVVTHQNISNTMRINSKEEVEVEQAITLQCTDQSQQTGQMSNATNVTGKAIISQNVELI